jgi:hypothetical protein
LALLYRDARLAAAAAVAAAFAHIPQEISQLAKRADFMS